MARVEELLVFKAMAGRPRDIDDAVTLLTLYPHVDLARVRRRLVALAELAEAPELMQGLEQILHAAKDMRVTRTSAAMKPLVRRSRLKAIEGKTAKSARRSARTRVAGGSKKARKQPPR